MNEGTHKPLTRTPTRPLDRGDRGEYAAIVPRDIKHWQAELQNMTADELAEMHSNGQWSKVWAMIGDLLEHGRTSAKLSAGRLAKDLLEVRTKYMLACNEVVGPSQGTGNTTVNVQTAIRILHNGGQTPKADQ